MCIKAELDGSTITVYFYSFFLLSAVSGNIREGSIGFPLNWKESDGA